MKVYEVGKMTKESQCREIYHGIVLIVAALAIALIPSVMIWKLHIMSLEDLSVKIGIACCYVFAVLAVAAGGYFLRKSLVSGKAESEESQDTNMQLQHS